MSKQNILDTIQLDTPAYKNLGLNDQIAVFNRVVHAYEDERQKKITAIWEGLNENFIQPKELSEHRCKRINLAFGQALNNLTKMMEAKSLYEADLYRQSYLKALERVKTPRRRFVMMQTTALELSHDSNDFQARLTAIDKELTHLAPLYRNQQPLFDQARRELMELSQIKDASLFKNKRSQLLNTLADIYEQAQLHSEIEKQCESQIEEAMHCGQDLFNARSAYLEDKNHWMNRASNIAEKSWVGIGAGLTLAPVVFVVGIVAAPVVSIVAGIAGAVYGVVDLARTVGSTVTNETTTKLGERLVTKPKTSWRNKLATFIKKAVPIALCVFGAAAAITATILTAGVAGVVLAGVGVAVLSGGLGMMAKDKYDERKEVLTLKKEHQELNETFDKQDEELLHEISKDLAKHVHEDSSKETMSLLNKHAVVPEVAKKEEAQMEKAKMEEESVEQKSNDTKELQTEPNLQGSENVKEEDDKEEDEGGEEGSESNEDKEDDSQPPILRP